MSQYIAKDNVPSGKGVRIAIVTTEWNDNITGRLTESAVATLKKHGVGDNDCPVFTVPGAVELTFAASQLIEAELFNAIIVFGCVIRGGTPHFDYVCQSVTQGITTLNGDCDIPVVFGVLTVNNLQEALDRAGGPHGDKGAECAECALKMVAFNKQVEAL